MSLYKQKQLKRIILEMQMESVKKINEIMFINWLKKLLSIP